MDWRLLFSPLEILLLETFSLGAPLGHNRGSLTLVNYAYSKQFTQEHHHVLSDQHNALSSKCYSLLMRAKPYPYILPSQKSSPLTPTTSPGLITGESVRPVTQIELFEVHLLVLTETRSNVS